MDLNLFLQMMFHLVGGLGIFLIGMKYMQQGLQVIAGPKIRKMINAVTANRFFAVGIGLFVTTLVQSSSVTSVMVIGLVNSNLMALQGAMGVLIGANIGTTITGWILALKIGKYGLPVLGVASFGWLFIKKEKIKYVCLAFLGIGMIFFGLELMKNGFKPIRGMPEFEAWFLAFKATSYIGVLKAAAVGCILTVIVQSSSATLGITIALATTGVIDFQTAAALVLGENIGTTITAYLASIGAEDTTAKRVAYFHIMFNVIGVAWITAIFLPIYLPFIRDVVIGQDIGVQAPDGTFPMVAAAIAAVHTGFNVANTILFIFLIGPIAKFLNNLDIRKKKSAKTRATSLEFQPGGYTVSAMEQSRYEIVKLDKHVKSMVRRLRAIIDGDLDEKENKKNIESIFGREESIDRAQVEITTFLTDLLSQSLSHEIAEEARSQLRVTDEYESVSDYIATILKSYLRMRDGNVAFSETQQKELLRLHDTVATWFKELKIGEETHLQDIQYAKLRAGGADVDQLVRELRDSHWDRLSHETISPLVSTSYMDIANGYRKIKDHVINIGEAMIGGKSVAPELVS